MRVALRIPLVLVVFGLLAHRTAAKPPSEGMWIPLLLKSLNEADMQAMGLQLSADDLYATNKSSLKDAVVSLGGFCTGELISPQGLLLTNHHCGYGAIRSHSRRGRDFLRDGFWAVDHAAELPNPGLTATFIVRIDEVTEAVLGDLSPDLKGETREAALKSRIAALEREAMQGTHYEARVKAFFHGNEYYRFVTETFRDLRFVGAPPAAVGRYGGDSDNWTWPRHTADFALFRIYADTNNRPADYSPDNVPYRPRHYFPISLEGVDEGDFTMVYGFPGETDEYLTSYALKARQEVSNPILIRLRKTMLAVMDRNFRNSGRLRTNYAAAYAALANDLKRRVGESRGLEKTDVIRVRREGEMAFARWLGADIRRQEEFGHLLREFREAYQARRRLLPQVHYLREGVFRIGLVDFALYWRGLGASEGTVRRSVLARLRKRVKTHFRTYNAGLDRQLCAELLAMYFDIAKPEAHPELHRQLARRFKGNVQKYTDFLFGKSQLVTRQKAQAFLEGFRARDVARLRKDPAYRLMQAVHWYHSEVLAPKLEALDARIADLSRQYLAAMRQMYPDRRRYPDANGTLRLSYGKVRPYSPENGIAYRHYTTMEGVLEKYKPGDPEYDLPPSYLNAFRKRDFGRYAQDSTLRINFIASNHTTQGNSGSPVLNGSGQLVGINFDRNWEGSISDICYDPDAVRNISVDIRYVLYIVDKVAHASHLLSEMTLVTAD